MNQLWNELCDLFSKLYGHNFIEENIAIVKPIEYKNNTLTLSTPLLTNKISEAWENYISPTLKGKYPNLIVKVVQESIDTTPTKDNTKSSKMMNYNKLNPDYTFENFIIGPNNNMAHAAALVDATNNRDYTYNPLFIYGGVGLGKTHLMQAIGNHLLKEYDDIKIKYITTETFTSEFISALQNKTMDEFKESYRNIEALLIDDIQFLEGKESTIEEFFHTFNTLFQNSKLIVLTSDKKPEDLKNLPNRLVNRFESGLPVNIMPPDLETRTAILRSKADMKKIDISDDALIYIAGQVDKSVRNLEQSLNHVHLYAKMKGENYITTELVSESLTINNQTNESKVISIELIQSTVAKYFNITVADIKGKKRNKEIVIPRQIAMFLCRELTQRSLPKIGDQFGGKDHSTVIHAINSIERKLKDNLYLDIQHDVDELIKLLK